MQLEGSLRPATGLQEQDDAPEPDSSVPDPAQTVAEPDATAVGGGTTVIVSSFEVNGPPKAGVVVSTR